MSAQSSHPVPPLDVLRALAAAQGVRPTDEDLLAARSFLEAILPALAELERTLPAGLPPAGLFAPEQGDG